VSQELLIEISHVNDEVLNGKAFPDHGPGALTHAPGCLWILKQTQHGGREPVRISGWYQEADFAFGNEVR
jgi:hypothetical protein